MNNPKRTFKRKISSYYHAFLTQWNKNRHVGDHTPLPWPSISNWTIWWIFTKFGVLYNKFASV